MLKQVFILIVQIIVYRSLINAGIKAIQVHPADVLRQNEETGRMKFVKRFTVTNLLHSSPHGATLTHCFFPP